MGNIVGVDSSRLAAVETNVEHLSKDVGDIKTELHAINEINRGVGNSLVKLTILAEQNQKRDEMITPRLAELEEWLGKLEKWQARKDGVILAVVVLFSLFGDTILNFIK